MHIIKNVIIVILAIFIGSLTNLSIIELDHLIFEIPEGLDLNNMEDLDEFIQSLPFYRLLFPFFAHSMGTLIAAYLVSKFSISYSFYISLGIGALFMASGIYMVLILNAPLYFELMDLCFAYIPAAWLGHKLGSDS